jgi:hypothetical protein
MGGFKARLKKAKGSWNKGKERGGGFEEMPDGLYICKLSNAEVKESESGKLGFLLTYRILEGEKEGQNITDWNGLEHEVSCSILMRKLRKLRVTVPDDIEDIEETVDELVQEKPRVRLKLKSRKGKDGDDRTYQDTIVDRWLGVDGGDDEDEDDEYEIDDSDDSEADAPDQEDDDSDEEPKEASLGEQAQVGDAVHVNQEGDKWTGQVIEVRDDCLVVRDPEADESDNEFEVDFDEVIGLKKKPEEKKGRRRRSSKPVEEEPEEAPEEEEEVEDDPDEDEDEDFDEVELKEGMVVNVDNVGECKILKLDEKKNLVTVQPVGGGRKKRVSPDDIEVIPAAEASAEAPKRGRSRKK